MNALSKTDRNGKIHIGSIAIFFGLIFLFMGTGENIQIANNAFFFIIATITNGLNMFFYNKKISLNYITYCFAILLIFNYLFWTIGESDHGIAMGLFLNLLLIFTTSNMKYNEKDIKMIVNGLIISSIIFSILLIFFGKGYSGAIYSKMTYTQTFGNYIEFEPNFLALILITGFEFSVWAMIKNIENKNKYLAIIYTICAIVTLVSAFLTGSRSVLVTACIFAVLLVLFIQNHKVRRRLIFVILLITVALVIAISTGLISTGIYERMFVNSYNDGSNSHRLENWKHGLMSMRDHFFGSGPYESAYIMYKLYGYTSAAHNTFVSFGVYFGWIGFIVFIFLIVGLAISAWRYKQRQLFAMIISMIFQWNILECQHTLSMWIFLLICILIINKLKNGQELETFEELEK